MHDGRARRAMIDGKKVLALITARVGSKGLPGKNIRPLAGKPLIAWTIAAAKASRLVDRTVLSTDDDAIAAVAAAAGCEAPFRRPAELAGDETPSEPVALDALARLNEKFDYLVLLQPTSPLRLAEDIDGAIALCHAKKARLCVSVVESAKPPFWSCAMDEDGRLRRLLPAGGAARRQDLPRTFAPNGAVFVARVDGFGLTPGFRFDDAIGYVMPPERSVDIDTLLDFRLAELLLAESNPRGN